MDLNKAQVIGNITQDLELKETPNGSKVLSFSVATNRKWTDGSGQKQERADFHNIVLWGKIAEVVAQYQSKGNKVYIEGRMETKSWEAQDGTKRYKTEIVGENVIMLGGNNGGNTSAPANTTTTTDKPAASTANEETSVEDLPF